MERVFEVTRRKRKNRGRKGWYSKKQMAEIKALKALSSAQPLIPSLPTTNVDEQIVKREAPEEEDEYVWKATNEATKVEDDPIRSKRPMEGIKMVAAQEPERNKRKNKNRGRKGWRNKKTKAEKEDSAQPPLISPPSTLKTEAPEESKDSVCRSWMGSRGEPGSCLLTSGTLTSGFGDISVQFNGYQNVPDHEKNSILQRRMGGFS